MSVAPTSTVNEQVRNLRVLLGQIQIIVDVNPLFRVDTRLFTGAVSLTVALRTEWVRYYLAQCIRLSLDKPFDTTDALPPKSPSDFLLKYGYSMVTAVTARGDRPDAAKMIEHYELLYGQLPSPERFALPMQTAPPPIATDDLAKQQAVNEVAVAILNWFEKYDDRTAYKRQNNGSAGSGNSVVDGMTGFVRSVAGSVNASVTNAGQESLRSALQKPVVREVVDNIIYNAGNITAENRYHFTQRVELRDDEPPVIPVYPAGVAPDSEAGRLLLTYSAIVGWNDPAYGAGFNAPFSIADANGTPIAHGYWATSFIIYTFLERGETVPGDLNPYLVENDATRFMNEVVLPYQNFVATRPPKPSTLLTYLQSAEVRQLVDQIIFESAPGGAPSPPYNKIPGFIPPVEPESAGDRLLLYYEAIYGCDFTGTPQPLAQEPNELILRTYIDILTTYTYQKRGLTPPASTSQFYDVSDGTAFNTQVLQAYLNPVSGPPPESGFPTPEPGIFTVPLPSGGIQVNLSSQESREDAVQLILNEMARSNPDIARVLATLTPDERNALVLELAAGDLAAFGKDAVTDLLLPYMGGVIRNTKIEDLLKGKLNWSARPDPNPAAKPTTADDMYPADYRDPIDLNSVSTRAQPRRDGNVGHKGTMVVRLGGVPFEIPPAVDTALQVAGGQTRVPRTMPGIGIFRTNNQAELPIPGSVSVYQALGALRVRLQFVGAFLGYDHKRLMNGDKTYGAQLGQRKEYYSQANPDPLYTAPGLEGGSWAFSRKFDDMVLDGMPREFEIFSGIVQIKYSIIVKDYERFYKDDTRTYYFFDCYIINAAELTQSVGRFISNLPARRASILATSVRIVSAKPVVANGAGPNQQGPTQRPTETLTPAQLTAGFNTALREFQAADTAYQRANGTAATAAERAKMEVKLVEMQNYADRLGTKLPPDKKQQLLASQQRAAETKAQTPNLPPAFGATSNVSQFLGKYNEATASYKSVAVTIENFLSSVNPLKGATTDPTGGAYARTYDAIAAAAAAYKTVPTPGSTLVANMAELRNNLNALNGQMTRAGFGHLVRSLP